MIAALIRAEYAHYAPVNMGLVIFQSGEVSIRVGVVRLSASAFELFPSWRELIKLY